METSFWLARKLFFTRKNFWTGSSLFAVLGLIMGVASLVTAMAVMSGFESTLKSAVVDVTGHVRVVRGFNSNEKWEELDAKVRDGEPTAEIRGVSRFTFVEGIVTHQGQISGVILQGVDPQQYQTVLNFSNRIIQGVQGLDTTAESVPRALIGKGISQKLNLKAGDKFRVVLPIADRIDPNKFHRRIKEFQVGGVLDLGKFDWNERMMVTDMTVTQELAEIGDRYSGLIYRFSSAEKAREASFRISQKLGGTYSVRDWHDLSENLFEAVRIERVVIFFVVLVIVIVAAFNISSSLFVTILRRYSDIAILKALGARRRDIILIFSLQGLFVGIVGVVGGSLVGKLLCEILQVLQHKFRLVSGAVYKLDNIDVLIRWQDLTAIFIATIIICLIATLAPAMRGAKLNPVEGFRYG